MLCVCMSALRSICLDSTNLHSGFILEDCPISADFRLHAIRQDYIVTT